MISGQVPPDAIDRKNGTSKIGQLMRLVPGVSKKVNDAIMLALSLDPPNRPSSVKDFQKLLASNNESPSRRIIDEDKAPPLRNNRYARNKNHQENPSLALVQRREKPVPTVENTDNTTDSAQKIKHIETTVFLSLLFPGIGHFYLELYYMATILLVGSVALASIAGAPSIVILAEIISAISAYKCVKKIQEGIDVEKFEFFPKSKSQRESDSEKSKKITFLLCLVLGYAGGHHFYVGNNILGGAIIACIALFSVILPPFLFRYSSIFIPSQ
ncbi:membrane protein containing TM2 domain protein [Candidatus Magnetobacterium bavaricum]|uniref:Membrane protein containing TM2 domain protein n=1 Tax=Candidatus Magnetobacterium bavaricum TaxID=29290 RepID=A0A0F3GR91_9BACT|nr:membrane protein containing TM2 domain protein [Candidatus Magnetobacterium bavaricum]